MNFLVETLCNDYELSFIYHEFALSIKNHVEIKWNSLPISLMEL